MTEPDVESKSEQSLLIVLTLVVVLAATASLLIGSGPLATRTWLPSLAVKDPSIAQIILWQIRVPRAALSLLIGFALGLTGAALQGFLRNPLAEPGLVGASSGAALGAVIVFYFGLTSVAFFILPLGGIAGALIALEFFTRLPAKHPLSRRLFSPGSRSTPWRAR